MCFNTPHFVAVRRVPRDKCVLRARSPSPEGGGVSLRGCWYTSVSGGVVPTTTRERETSERSHLAAPASDYWVRRCAGRLPARGLQSRVLLRFARAARCHVQGCSDGQCPERGGHPLCLTSSETSRLVRRPRHRGWAWWCGRNCRLPLRTTGRYIFAGRHLPRTVLRA